MRSTSLFFSFLPNLQMKHLNEVLRKVFFIISLKTFSLNIILLVVGGLGTREGGFIIIYMWAVKF